MARKPDGFRFRGPVRRAVVRRFPYTVHFIEESDRVVVLAVFQAAKNTRELIGRA